MIGVCPECNVNVRAEWFRSRRLTHAESENGNLVDDESQTHIPFNSISKTASQVATAARLGPPKPTARANPYFINVMTRVKTACDVINR